MAILKHILGLLYKHLLAILTCLGDREGDVTRGQLACTTLWCLPT